MSQTYKVTVKHEDVHTATGDSAIAVANAFIRRRELQPGAQTISVVRAEGYDAEDTVKLRVREEMLAVG